MRRRVRSSNKGHTEWNLAVSSARLSMLRQHNNHQPRMLPLFIYGSRKEDKAERKARLKAEREERKRLWRERWEQLQLKREEQLREKLKSHSENWTDGYLQGFRDGQAFAKEDPNASRHASLSK
jgi:hypothetical protein